MIKEFMVRVVSAFVVSLVSGYITNDLRVAVLAYWMASIGLEIRDELRALRRMDGRQ